MFIDCYPNSGKPYLRVCESYTTKEDGKRKNRKRVICKIGPLSRFDDGRPNFLKRLRQSFSEGAPLIPWLEELASATKESRILTVQFNKDIAADAVCSPKNIGYFLLDALYDKLGIQEVFNLQKSRSKLEYDLNGLAKLLIFGRVLDPDSKRATWCDRGRYLFDVTASDNLIEVYRALDVFDEKAEAVQKRMNLKIGQAIGRDTDICFYDVTNYWFEIDDNDKNITDINGDIVKEGLRKRGSSKAKTRKPIVQMGLFMDSNGIPIAYKLFPGNHIDQTTLRPAMKKTIGAMSFGRVIIVADGGLNSGKNLAHIVSSGNGYIVSRSAKGSDKNTKKWILDQTGYVSNSTGTFKSKSRIIERTVADENGEIIKIKEKTISYWSRAQYLHALHENQNFMEYLDSVIKFPDKLNDKPSKLQKYLKTEQVDKKTGEIINTVSFHSLDMKKIQTDIDLMGYYTIMTSEVDMPDHEVIDKYHGLSRIENCFRTIKTDLDGRPVFVKKNEHINAHFLICFIALTMLRLIQYQILVHLGKETKNVRNWELGLSADRIKKALEEFKADTIPGGYYRLTRLSADGDLIMNAIGVNADIRIPTEHELRQLKYQFDKANIM